MNIICKDKIGHDVFIEDESLAYKDGKMYKIFQSTKEYIVQERRGKVKIIVDNGEILKVIQPKMSTGEYETFYPQKIQHYKKVIEAYDKFVLSKTAL